MSVLCFFLVVPYVGLQCVIVAFPGHTHLMSYITVITFYTLCMYLDTLFPIGESSTCTIY